MKDYDQDKESSYLKYWDVNKLYGWSMSQNLSVNGSKRVENTLQFNEDVIENYNEDSDEGCFLLRLMFNIRKKCMNFMMIYNSYLKE